MHQIFAGWGQWKFGYGFERYAKQRGHLLVHEGLNCGGIKLCAFTKLISELNVVGGGLYHLESGNAQLQNKIGINEWHNEFASWQAEHHYFTSMNSHQ